MLFYSLFFSSRQDFVGLLITWHNDIDIIIDIANQLRVQVSAFSIRLFQVIYTP